MKRRKASDANQPRIHIYSVRRSFRTIGAWGLLRIDTERIQQHFPSIDSGSRMESHARISSSDRLPRDPCFIFFVIAQLPAGSQQCPHHGMVNNAQNVLNPQQRNNFTNRAAIQQWALLRDLSVNPNLLGPCMLVEHPDTEGCEVGHLEDWIFTSSTQSHRLPWYMYRYRVGVEQLDESEVYIISRDHQVYRVTSGHIVLSWTTGPHNVNPARTYTLPAPPGYIHPRTGQPITHLVLKVLVTPFRNGTAPINTL